MESVHDLSDLLVGFCHLQQIAHIGAAGISHQTAAADEHFLQLSLGVLTGEAHIHDSIGRQGACALGREGALAVQCVLGIHNAALHMSAHGHTAAHVADDQVQILILFAHFLGVALGNGLLIQGVELAHAEDRGITGIARHIAHLIHNGGIGNERGDAQLVTDLLGDQAAQIAGVLTLYACDAVGQQGVGGGIGTAADGLDQTAASGNSIQLLGVEMVLGQRFQYQLLAPFLLSGNGVELGDFFGGVTQGLVKEQLLVLKHADLGGSGAGIDNQNLIRHDVSSSCSNHLRLHNILPTCIIPNPRQAVKMIFHENKNFLCVFFMRI